MIAFLTLLHSPSPWESHILCNISIAQGNYVKTKLNSKNVLTIEKHTHTAEIHAILVLFNSARVSGSFSPYGCLCLEGFALTQTVLFQTQQQTAVLQITHVKYWDLIKSIKTIEILPFFGSCFIYFLLHILSHVSFNTSSHWFTV